MPYQTHSTEVSKKLSSIPCDKSWVLRVVNTLVIWGISEIAEVSAAQAPMRSTAFIEHSSASMIWIRFNGSTRARDSQPKMGTPCSFFRHVAFVAAHVERIVNIIRMKYGGFLRVFQR